MLSESYSQGSAVVFSCVFLSEGATVCQRKQEHGEHSDRCSSVCWPPITLAMWSRLSLPLTDRDEASVFYSYFSTAGWWTFIMQVQDGCETVFFTAPPS